jgi:hypothetical protein
MCNGSKPSLLELVYTETNVKVVVSTKVGVKVIYIRTRWRAEDATTCTKECSVEYTRQIDKLTD